jgi:hypothetical protein
MHPDQRVVVSLPLAEIWDSSGPIAATRGRQLSTADITQLLRAGPIQFVVADFGPLRWIPTDSMYDFWKCDAKHHILSPGRSAALEEFPGEYFYVATEWIRAAAPPATPLIVLERHH